MTKAIKMALALGLMMLPAGGCLAAAAGAGAAGAIAYDNRGAQSMVKGKVSDVAADARIVLTEMEIALDGDDGTNGDENGQTVTGTRGEMRFRVSIERESSTTSEVRVTAREGTLDYDREVSRDVLSRIMARR